MNTLLSSYKLSDTIYLKNRIVMAPMTRRCALEDHTPTEIMVPYYARRADAGLIVTEGTLISEDAIGYGNVPGIFTDEHINAWHKITTAVHQNGGIIFIQLWHCGRISNIKFHQGLFPISSSSTHANVMLGSTQLPCSPSREATKEEIDGLILTYTQAAKNAMAAGFDGIELHGANGYLIDQFLHECTNQRSDEYGNTPENRSRFVLDVIQSCGNAIGYDRVSIRLSPAGHMNEIITSHHDKHTFTYLLEKLNLFNIAYVHTGTFDDAIEYPELDNKTMTDFIRSVYNGTVIASGGYNLDSAKSKIDKKECDLVAIGRLFISNPNLILNLKTDNALIDYDKSMLGLELY